VKDCGMTLQRYASRLLYQDLTVFCSNAVEFSKITLIMNLPKGFILDEFTHGIYLVKFVMLSLVGNPDTTAVV
jgi:hypothetical protein